MSNLFELSHTVLPSEIDALEHVNNQVYLDWFLKLGLAHSKARGWPLERLLKQKSGWVIRRHEIDYLQQAKLGEDLLFRTWIASFERSSSLRHYEILRAKDLAPVAKGSTVFVWISYETGRPVPIPQEVISDFGLTL